MQHFEIDGGGIKCSLTSKKEISSNFVVVSVPVKSVQDKKNHVYVPSVALTKKLATTARVVVSLLTSSGVRGRT